MDLKPAPEIISQRLKGQLTPAYLTLTSIIQGVALAFLAARVEATYAQFDTANWLLTSATFVGFLTLWNEYLMQVLTFVWVPTLVDSLVPFAFLAGELFMAHFVYGGLRYWLLSLGLTFVVGTLASIVTNRQARNFPEENRDVARAHSVEWGPGCTQRGHSCTLPGRVGALRCLTARTGSDCRCIGCTGCIGRVSREFCAFLE